MPVTHIDDIVWDGRKLRISGYAYLAGLSVRSRRANWATVVLRGPRWLPPVRLRTRRVLAPEATHGAREVGCNYDWSGFTAELNPWALRWRGAARGMVSAVRRRLRRRPAVADTTTWRAEIVFWSRGARATGLLRGYGVGRSERPARPPAQPRLVGQAGVDLRPRAPGGVPAQPGRAHRRPRGRRAPAVEDHPG
ncbi:hypothetical protein ACFSTC_05750 [Nonomuraea ferruginea]